MSNETSLTLERWNERADHPLAPLVVSLVGIVWVFISLYSIVFLLDLLSQPNWVLRTVWLVVAPIPAFIAFRLKDRALATDCEGRLARFRERGRRAAPERNQQVSDDEAEDYDQTRPEHPRASFERTENHQRDPDKQQAVADTEDADRTHGEQHRYNQPIGCSRPGPGTDQPSTSRRLQATSVFQVRVSGRWRCTSEQDTVH